MNDHQQKQCAARLQEAFPDSPGNVDIRTRSFLVLEEAFELAQAANIPLERAMALGHHVYSRPVGQVEQEAAGVAVTILLFAQAIGRPLVELIDMEIASFKTRIPEIREKSKQKVTL